MSPLILTTGLALAEPAVTRWSAQVVGFTGAEQWTEAHSGMGGLQGSVGLQRRAALTWQGYASSEVFWWAQSPYDFHFATLALEAPSRLGVSLTGIGSTTSSWLELAPAGTARIGNFRVTFGPALRRGEGIGAAGFGGTVAWQTDLGASVSGWTRLGADVWSDFLLPAQVLRADLGLRWRPTSDLTLSGSAGLSSTLGTSEDWIMGLPPSDARILRGRLSADRRVTHSLSLRGELSGDRGAGTLDYHHIRLTIGAAARIGRTHRSTEPPPPHTFTLHAPDAETVSVMGTFSDWQPVEMSRSTDGTWTVSLPLTTGLHEYSYLVDGAPLVPPEATRRTDDGFGGENGVLLIGG